MGASSAQITLPIQWQFNARDFWRILKGAELRSRLKNGLDDGHLFSVLIYICIGSRYKSNGEGF